jgi:deazaflavin-dependent oxidoreductase (nitroreductase family)
MGVQIERAEAVGRPVRRLTLALVVAIFLAYYGTALLERLLSRPSLRRFQRAFGNPSGERMSRLPGWALLETTGRRSGERRHIPVGGRIIGGDFWMVAVDPHHAGYVKNIEAEPSVRVRTKNEWRTGFAQLLPSDNPRRRMFQVNPVNGLYILIAGRNHLTIQVQLDPFAG